jgi:hypothetical protein
LRLPLFHGNPVLAAGSVTFAPLAAEVPERQGSGLIERDLVPAAV